MKLMDLLREHHYLNIGQKCACMDPEVGGLTNWTAHVQTLIITEKALDALEDIDIPVHGALVHLHDADDAARAASESDNPHAFAFAAGLMAGLTQRAIAMLNGEVV